MLRISANEVASGSVLLRLDGQVTGQWVELLEKTCEVQLNNNARVTIDLKNVSFADREGIMLLRRLTDCGVEVVNGLPFIKEQIRKATS